MWCERVRPIARVCRVGRRASKGHSEGTPRDFFATQLAVLAPLLANGLSKGGVMHALFIHHPVT